MSHIDYYFSTISPFAYLAGNRLETIANNFNADITYKPLDIVTLFSKTGGVALADRHPARQAYRLQELARQSKKNNLPLNLRPSYFPTNAAPSAYAVIAAQEEGTGNLGALVRAVLSACWVNEQDIAKDSVIKRCLNMAGFDPMLSERGLALGAEIYSHNLEEAIENNVFGSPFYIVNGSEKFWGQDRLEDLEAFLAGNL